MIDQREGGAAAENAVYDAFGDELLAELGTCDADADTGRATADELPCLPAGATRSSAAG